MQNISLNISSIGNSGDGVSEYNGKKVYVPFSYTGEIIEAQVEEELSSHINARISKINTPSSHRSPPPCEYFTKCGGCKLQHLNEDAYSKFKSEILSDLIKSLKVEYVDIEPLFVVPQHSRRRVEFKISVHKGNINIGFFAPRSHNVIDIQNCLVADNNINSVIPHLKEAIKKLKKPSVITSANITSLKDGLDVIINTRSKLSQDENNIFTELAKTTQIARLNILAENSEYQTLYDTEKLYVEFGSIKVLLPTGAFLQATNDSQNALIDFVENNLHGHNKIADLYSGCGTFSFPIAKNANFIGSYEGSDEMVSTIYNASLQNNLEQKINATKRNLFNKPLSPKELNNYDAVIVNPPRNGALPQIRNISKSQIKKLIMISCNPKTFKRDALNLLQNGFKIKSIRAIDQFLYSPHLEIAACFIR